MFGGLFRSITHRIKWIFIFILVIFGYIAFTNPSGIGSAATQMGNVIGAVVGGIITIIQSVGHAIGQSGVLHK